MTLTLQERYDFHKATIQRFWSIRHQRPIATGGVTHGQCFRWNLAVMRRYRDRMRAGEV